MWQPVNNSPLIVFRILFGIVITGQCLYSLCNGIVEKFYILPGYNFTFIGFEWLNYLHGAGMYFYFSVMILLGLMIAFGLFYRIAIIMFAILWSGIYLSSKTQYNNHYYLILLLCWLMVFIPANKRNSLDVKISPAIFSNNCYQWQVWLFIFQVACMYFFAGLAKLNYDWLHAVPLKYWLPLKTGIPYIGHFLRNPLMPWLIAYGGLLLDLLVVPGLLYYRTRKLVFIILIAFHLFNGIVFQIGSFPFLAVSLSVFFFPATFFDKALLSNNQDRTQLNHSDIYKRWVNIALSVYITLQIFLPIRHLLIKGSVSWTEEGHRMAWQMMLRSKRGEMFFSVKDKKNDSVWRIQPNTIINKESLREIAVLPDVTWQAAQVLKNKYASQKLNVAIYAHCNVSLNYKAYKMLIDTTVDLSSVKWNYFRHNNWILLYDN